jgi:hypothetical protein
MYDLIPPEFWDYEIASHYRQGGMTVFTLPPNLKKANKLVVIHAVLSVPVYYPSKCLNKVRDFHDTL